RDEPAIKLEEKRENEQEMLKLMDARQQAVFQIGKIQEDADAYLAEKLKDWVEDLRKAGRKVRTALLNQSRAAEVGLASAAAQMADNYPDIVRRLQPVVAGGRWLDARQVLPQLDEAQRGAVELHDQHLKVIG